MNQSSDNVSYRPGDFVKVQPRDPHFAMMTSSLLLVAQIINDYTFVTVDNNIIDLVTFRIIYVNGREYDKYTIDDIVEEGD
jgi:hypothetical protein